MFEATVNHSAVLEMQVTATSSDSTVARMIKLVTEAHARRAPPERFSAWFGQRYTVAVLVGSLVVLGDSDTIDLCAGPDCRRIRLCGIDTPERDRPGYAAAWRALTFHKGLH